MFQVEGKSLTPSSIEFSLEICPGQGDNRTGRPLAARWAHRCAPAVLVLAGCLFAARIASGDGTNSFPDINEVLQARVFTNEFARDVFFLRQIRERYPTYWPSLLAVNITGGDYVVTPEKLRRFVEEAGVAGEGSDDPVAVASLASIVSAPAFYTNASQVEVQQAVVASLIQIGPKGKLALADAFSQAHYRTDPESLEVLADAIGKTGLSDSKLAAALAATAFTFTATNGGSYPKCTRETVRSLLCLSNGLDAVRGHLNTNEMFNDPGRFQAVVDGIAAAHADALATNLQELAAAAKNKLAALAPGPDPYRDDLAELRQRLRQASKQPPPASK